MLTAHRVEGTQTDRPVFLEILEQLEQAVLPQGDAFVFPQQGHSLLLEHPPHRVVDVFKMVVEVLPGHAAGAHNLGYADLGQRLLRHQSLEGGADLPLGGIARQIGPFFHACLPYLSLGLSLSVQI